MIPEWQKIKNRLEVGAEDFKSIRSSVLKFAKSLQKHYRFMIPFQNQPSKELADKQCLKLKMEEYLERSRQDYLREQWRTGRTDAPDFESFIIRIGDENERKKIRNNVKLKAWQKAKGHFLEALCFLSYLNKFKPAGITISHYHIFKKTGPIPVTDEGKERFLWYQPIIKETRTEMRARPDIAITNSIDEVSKDTIINLIECKCREQLSASDIRAEYGKAFDLEVDSYIIVAYHGVTDRLKSAAIQLGIDIEEFGLHSPDREKYITGEKNLEEDLSISLYDKYRKGSFSKKLTEVAKRAIIKSISPEPHSDSKGEEEEE